MVEARQHWETVYKTKRPTDVSWYRPHLEISVQLIEEAVTNRDACIIDVGAGESTLVDDLLAHGYRNLYALDLSVTALDVAKARLGANASRINWLCGDVRNFSFSSEQFDLWHDRAVFHFLTDSADRVAYVRQVAKAVKPGGHVIVATFGPQGPTQCSGLDVMRYSPEALHDEFGAHFRLVKHCSEQHQTPKGSTQQFTYCYCRVSQGA